METDNDGNHDIEIENIGSSNRNFNSNCEIDQEPIQLQAEQQIQWQKPILIVGKAGSGKSQTLFHCVHRYLEKGKAILVLAPTGHLASRFRSTLPSAADCDTVHAAFHIPVSDDDRATTNWALSHYDIIITDEISMISYFSNLKPTELLPNFSCFWRHSATTTI